MQRRTVGGDVPVAVALRPPGIHGGEPLQQHTQRRQHAVAGGATGKGRGAGQECLAHHGVAGQSRPRRMGIAQGDIHRHRREPLVGQWHAALGEPLQQVGAPVPCRQLQRRYFPEPPLRVGARFQHPLHDARLVVSPHGLHERRVWPAARMIGEHPMLQQQCHAGVIMPVRSAQQHGGQAVARERYRRGQQRGHDVMRILLGGMIRYLLVVRVGAVRQQQRRERGAEGHPGGAIQRTLPLWRFAVRVIHESGVRRRPGLEQHPGDLHELGMPRRLVTQPAGKAAPREGIPVVGTAVGGGECGIVLQPLPYEGSVARNGSGVHTVFRERRLRRQQGPCGLERARTMRGVDGNGRRHEERRGERRVDHTLATARPPRLTVAVPALANRCTGRPPSRSPRGCACAPLPARVLRFRCHHRATGARSRRSARAPAPPRPP